MGWKLMHGVPCCVSASAHGHSQRRGKERGKGRDQAGARRSTLSCGPLQGQKRGGTERPRTVRERARQRDRDERCGHARQRDDPPARRQWQRGGGGVARGQSTIHVHSAQKQRYDGRSQRSRTHAAANGRKRSAHHAAEIHARTQTHARARDHCRQPAERSTMQRRTGQKRTRFCLRQLPPGGARGE